MRKTRLFVADFETEVYDGQTSTYVWAAALVELFTPTEEESVMLFTDIDSFFKYLFKLKSHIRIWFHNLKFDGSFIADYLLRQGYKFSNVKDMELGSYQFKCLISDCQRWYSFKIKKNHHIIEFRDSVKLAPLSVEECGKAYKTKYRKLSMDYKNQKVGDEIEPHKQRYIKHDVLVMKEVMELFISEGHDRLTIGSCCMKEFKTIFNDWAMGNESIWDSFFPDLKKFTDFDHEYFRAENAFEYVYRFYKGAWCYKKEGVTKVDQPGIIVDKTSMYPSHMDSLVHPHPYAVGLPTFFKGKPDESIIADKNKVAMICIKCKFKLKPKHFPTVQIKHSFLYSPTKWRTDSDFDIGEKSLARARHKGKVIESTPTLYLSEPDYLLFMESYEVWDLEYLGGCYFQGVYGIFDDYVEKYRKKKESETGGKRTISKLFSNNLYGKLATSDNSSYLVPYINGETDIMDFKLVVEHEKPTFAVQAGLLVTAYGRVDMITAANKHYDRFNYADTDSMHLTGNEEPDVEIHPSKYGAWKIEGRFRRAVYLRQKTYCEEIVEQKYSGLAGESLTETIGWEITCAGMPKRSKELFLNTYNPWDDFKEGTEIGGKLIPKRIKGGVILQETTFTIHEK